jgi:hypothetical protein
VSGWEEQYIKITDTFKNDGFGNDSYFSIVLDELQKLGADKVYFIEDNFTPVLAIPENATLDSYLSIVQQNTTYFEVVL